MSDLAHEKTTAIDHLIDSPGDPITLLGLSWYAKARVLFDLST